MDHIDTVPWILCGDVIRDQSIGGMAPFAFRGDGKQTRWFVDGDDILVLEKDGKVLPFPFGDRLRGYAYDILLNKRIVELADRNPTDGNLMMGEKGFDGLSGGIGHLEKEELHQGRLFAHRIIRNGAGIYQPFIPGAVFFHIVFIHFPPSKNSFSRSIDSRPTSRPSK